VLAIESDDGPLTRLMTAFREALIHDLEPDDFADMYAQTIAYGLLSARIANPSGARSTDRLPVMTPFLKELMETFLHMGGGRHVGADRMNFDELGVSEVVELLDDANIEAVVRDFGDRNPREDPVIHFYELFLKEYDARKRMRRGVFYTPRPVVSYIVRSADEMLRAELGLIDGLADTTTWGEMAKRHEGLIIPEGVSPEQDFVQILDPATGTGTFLVEVIDVIHETLLVKWKGQGFDDIKANALWNEYVPKHLLSRLHGYELLMAPYAIAHLKIGLKLYETGYHFGSVERARVFLTNSLEPPQDFSGRLAFAIPALAHEARAVNEVKEKGRFTVVIGNPPYSGDSANASRDADGHLTFIGRLIEDYKQVDGRPLGERQPKWLQDDYVKFIRFAEYLTSATGIGVIGYITNHSYLDNPTFRGMRQHMMTLLNHVSTLDLHGNTTKKETPPPGVQDENVFDIQQGVAIMLGLRRGSGAHKPIVTSASIWGGREKKYDTLATSSLATTKWEELVPTTPFYLFVPQNIDLRAEYERGWSITQIMPTFSVGFVTARDEFVIDYELEPLRERIEAFRESEEEMPTGEIRERYELKDTTSWNLTAARDVLRREAEWEKSFTRCLYRVFDVRYIFYSRDLLERPVYQIQRHLLSDGNLALLVSRQVVDNFAHVFVSNRITNFNALATAGRLGAGPVFPLYLTGDSGTQELEGLQARHTVNFGGDFLDALADTLALEMPSAECLPADLKPEDVFGYVYAVFHSGGYRRRYAEFLKRDFPRVPLPRDLAMFRVLARLGGELVVLHLLDSPKCADAVSEYVGPLTPQVERVSWSEDTVWLDRAQTIGFIGVLESVWNFQIGGYQVCQKWLKDRKSRTLATHDVAHYQKIIVAISETERLMVEIDRVVDEYGGWPHAFSPSGRKEAA
jgi:predicted helicase